MNNYSTKIKQIRIDNKLTQSDFANKLGVTRGVIALIETGKNNPTLNILNEIKEVFNVNLLEDEAYNKENTLSPFEINILKNSYHDNMKTLYFLCSLLKMNNYEFTEEEQKELYFYEDLVNILNDISTNKIKPEKKLIENLKHILNISFFRFLGDYYYKVQKSFNFEVIYNFNQILNKDFKITNFYK